MASIKSQKSGKTPLLHIPALCKKFNLPNLLIKDESKNPYGTWKDRRSELIIKKALTGSFKKICVITSGNTGFSLAKFATKHRIKIIAIIDPSLHPSIKIQLKNICYQLVEKNLAQKKLTPNLIKALVTGRTLEASNGFHKAYESIIAELKNEKPDYIICPIGSGEGFIGLYAGLKKANLKTKLIGVTPRINPSYADKLCASWKPYQKKINTIAKNGHKIVTIAEPEIKKTYSYAKKYIECEPSSAIVIAALNKIKFHQTDKIIIINSGKGLF